MRSSIWPKTGVFLDRDDTIIRDKNYLDDPDEIEILPGTVEALRTLNRTGIPVIVITNQSGIARGLLDLNTLDVIHKRLTGLIMQEGARIDAIYFCPHHPEALLEEYRVSCSCRKPEPGLLMEAARSFDLDLSLCYMVGDKPDDIEAIHRVGGKGILIRTNKIPSEMEQPDFTASDILEAVNWIIEDMKNECL
jgi:D-glycero-D-manno-heptose 1,7-bisphosphate phosphatase